MILYSECSSLMRIKSRRSCRRQVSRRVNSSQKNPQKKNIRYELYEMKMHMFGKAFR